MYFCTTIKFMFYVNDEYEIWFLNGIIAFSYSKVKKKVN